MDAPGRRGVLRYAPKLAGSWGPIALAPYPPGAPLGGSFLPHLEVRRRPACLALSVLVVPPPALLPSWRAPWRRRPSCVVVRGRTSRAPRRGVPVLCRPLIWSTALPPVARARVLLLISGGHSSPANIVLAAVPRPCGRAPPHTRGGGASPCRVVPPRRRAGAASLLFWVQRLPSVARFPRRAARAARVRSGRSRRGCRTPRPPLLSPGRLRCRPGRGAPPSVAPSGMAVASGCRLHLATRLGFSAHPLFGRASCLLLGSAPCYGSGVTWRVLPPLAPPLCPFPSRRPALGALRQRFSGPPHARRSSLLLRGPASGRLARHKKAVGFRIRALSRRVPSLLNRVVLPQAAVTGLAVSALRGRLRLSFFLFLSLASRRPPVVVPHSARG